MFKQLCYAGGDRDRPEGSRRVERLSHLVDRNNRRCLPDGRKGMQSPRKIENVKKKIHARGRCFSMGKATLPGPVAVVEDRLVAASRNSAEEEGLAEGQVRLLRAHDSVELGKVASGSVAQGLWLRDRKVRFQGIGKDQS